jgi:hypothetical protein
MSNYFEMNSTNGGSGGMALMPYLPVGGGSKENIRVAVRVRPLLPSEAHRDEVIYYPTYEEGPLQVRNLKFFIILLKSIKVADG